MTLADLGEFGALEALGLFRAALPPSWVGPGDDAAVVPSPAGALLFTADLLAEGVHFRRSTSPPQDLGYKCVAVNVSDVAAMGGRPLALTLSLACPPELPFDWLRSLYEGVEEACREFGCALVGGDTSTSPTLVVSVALVGAAPARGPVLRSGARPGDYLWVTGTLGDSAAGLGALEGTLRVPAAQREALARRHLRPSPRLALAEALGREGLATALIDVSDGLVQDLGHVLARSRAGAAVEVEELPLSLTLQEAAREGGFDGVALALAGGEDYELLFSAPPAAGERLLGVADVTATPLRRIGRIRAAPGLLLTRAGAPMPPPASGGFDHFRRRP